MTTERTPLSPEERWEQGVSHSPESYTLAQAIGDLDWDFGGWFDFKFGGDGDNGEHLAFLLDELRDRGWTFTPPAKTA